MKKAEKSYHHADLRKEIVREARKTIAREGISNFSLRDVARKLGVSHAAAYRHFRSKEDLLLELILDANKRFARCLKEARDICKESAADRLAALGEAYFEFGLSDRADLELLFGSDSFTLSQQAVESGLVTKEDLGEMDSFSLLQETISECIKDGFFPKQADPAGMSILFWSLVHGYCVLARNGVFDNMGKQVGLDENRIRQITLSQIRLLVGK